MKILKKSVLMLAVLLIVVQMPIAAMAHSGGHKHNRKTYETAHSLCDTAGCDAEGTHQHGNRYYSGHSMGDGHDYHEVCSLEDCTLSGVHQHDREYYFEHSLDDGHDYHAVCNVEGCTEVSKHEHESNTSYSGSGHHIFNHGHSGYHHFCMMQKSISF